MESMSFIGGAAVIGNEGAQLDTYDASLSSDELAVVYLQTPHAGGTDTMYLGTRADTSSIWTMQALSGVNVDNDLASPTLTNDGTTLYFSDYDVVSNSTRIFSATRADTTTTSFATPVLVAGQPASSTIDIFDPMLTRDETTLVFSERDSSAMARGADLFVLTRTCN